MDKILSSGEVKSVLLGMQFACDLPTLVARFLHLNLSEMTKENYEEPKYSAREIGRFIQIFVETYRETLKHNLQPLTGHPTLKEEENNYRRKNLHGLHPQ